MHGIYCDSDSIRAALEPIREEAAAEEAVLLVVMDDRIFDSLLISAGADMLGDDLRQSLRNAPRPGGGARTPDLSNLDGMTTFGGLADALGLAADPSCRTGQGRAIWLHSVPAPQVRAAAVVLVLVTDPAEPPRSLSAERVQSLAVMVHGTLPVITRQQLMIERVCEENSRRVEITLEDDDLHRSFAMPLEWRHQRYGHFAEAALKVAISTTESSSGAFIRLRRDRVGLDFDDAIVLGERPLLDPWFPLACERAFRSRQPFVVQPSDRQSGSTNSALAFPIVFRRFESTRRDVLAVIYLKKSGSRPPGFSAFDLNALARSARTCGPTATGCGCGRRRTCSGP